MNRYGFHILVNRVPVPCDDPREWEAHYDISERRVAEYDESGVRVSTVFLGLDNSFGDGPPLFFETMVFGGEHDGEMDRYTTWSEAEIGHEIMVALVCRS